MTPNSVHILGITIGMCKFVISGNRILGLVIRFRKSKCNQTKKLEKACVPCICGGLMAGRICAVHEVLRMLRLRRTRSQVTLVDPLFVWDDGSLFSYADMGRIIKDLCRKCDLKPENFSPHSLRAGGCVDYIGWGIDVSTVQDMGRWKCIDSMGPSIFSTDWLLDKQVACFGGSIIKQIDKKNDTT
jgi:hypothetical protein